MKNETKEMSSRIAGAARASERSIGRAERAARSRGRHVVGAEAPSRALPPVDAILRVTSAGVCGSDLWPYRGVEPVQGPAPRDHEYLGIVGQVGTRAKEMRVCVE